MEDWYAADFDLAKKKIQFYPVDFAENCKFISGFSPVISLPLLSLKKQFSWKVM